MHFIMPSFIYITTLTLFTNGKNSLDERMAPIWLGQNKNHKNYNNDYGICPISSVRTGSAQVSIRLNLGGW